MFSFPTILAAAGKALAAAAQHLEATPAGAIVESDVTKTLSDGATAAIGYVQQGATQPAVDATTAALTKVGLPSVVASALGSYAVSQGESFLSQLVLKAI